MKMQQNQQQVVLASSILETKDAATKKTKNATVKVESYHENYY